MLYPRYLVSKSYPSYQFCEYEIFDPWPHHIPSKIGDHFPSMDKIHQLNVIHIYIGKLFCIFHRCLNKNPMESSGFHGDLQEILDLAKNQLQDLPWTAWKRPQVETSGRRSEHETSWVLEVVRAEKQVLWVVEAIKSINQGISLNFINLNGSNWGYIHLWWMEVRFRGCLAVATRRVGNERARRVVGRERWTSGNSGENLKYPLVN